MNKPFITFDESAKKFVLDAIGYAVDKDGWIIHTQTKFKAYGYSDHLVKFKEWVGVVRGKLIDYNDLIIIASALKTCEAIVDVLKDKKKRSKN